MLIIILCAADCRPEIDRSDYARHVVAQLYAIRQKESLFDKVFPILERNSLCTRTFFPFVALTHNRCNRR